MVSPIDIKYSYAPVPTIREFAQSNAFIRGLMGGFGSGKSSGSVVEIIRRGQAQRPGPDGIRRTRWAVIRNTYPQLRDTTIKTVMQWLPELYFGKYNATDHRYMITSFAGVEIEILFRALDKPGDVSNLLSLELTGAWINEAREVPWAIVEALQGRVGRYPAQRDGGPSWFGLWMDTNPPDVDSKWYEFFEVMKHPEGFAEIFKQPSGLSPQAENLPNLPGGQQYYKTLSNGKKDEWNKVYIRGEYGFVVEGKLIYPDYSDMLHCREADPIDGVRVIRSWDFGLTPACAFSQLLPSGQWLTFDEITTDDMGIDRFSDRVLEHCQRAFRGHVQFEDWGDPAGDQRAQTDEKTCFQIMQAKEIYVEGSVQDPTLRWESVAKPLRTLVGGEPQFIMSPRCKVLRKGFMGGYHRRQLQTSGPERYSDKPEKNKFSHIHDALQYGMVQYFGGGLTAPKNNDDHDWPQTGYGSDEGRSSVTGY